jgi:hypothetical protein
VAEVPEPEPEDDGAAAAEAAEAERQRREADAAHSRANEEAQAARRASQEAERRAAERAAAAAAAERAAAGASDAERARLEQEAAAARQAAEEEAALARQAAEEEARRQEAARAAEEEQKKRQDEEKALAEKQAAEEAARAAEEAAVAEVDPGEAPPPVASGDCSELVKLEPMAMLGKLNDSQTACLEASLAAAPKMTDKDKISRVLMVNAYSKGDPKTWASLVKRHLDEINQSDPDLCYRYALHLSKKGASRSPGVIRWANVALENRTRWTGDTYVNRVNSLYKIKAAASQKLWKKAADDHAAAPTGDSQGMVDKYRNDTKVNAREWYEYAKQSGKDSTVPLQLCVSAAGTADYCEAG